VPNTAVHAVPTDAPSVDAAAQLYDATLRQLIDDDAPDAPTVDLALLGVGPDGHTASLFPGSLAVREQTRWALPVDAPTAVQPAVPRVTLTLPFLNAARAAIFLVAGKDKRPVMREILDGAESARRYPAALVTPRGRALWMIDRSAMPDERSNA
jgi:6-phosphogluconolactonase